MMKKFPVKKRILARIMGSAIYPWLPWNASVICNTMFLTNILKLLEIKAIEY